MRISYPDKFYASSGFEYRRLKVPLSINEVVHHWKFKPTSRHKDYKIMSDYDKMWDYATDAQMQAWRIAVPKDQDFSDFLEN